MFDRLTEHVVLPSHILIILLVTELPSAMSHDGTLGQESSLSNVTELMISFRCALHNNVHALSKQPIPTLSP